MLAELSGKVELSQPRSRRLLWGLGAAVLAAGVCAPVQNAIALWDDQFTPFVEEKVTRDDNVFRISKDVDPAGAIGSPSRGDIYRTLKMGIDFDVPVSRQHFQGSLTSSDTRYQRFSKLDFNGHEIRGVWMWQAGNRASGRLGYTETSSLASFENIMGTMPDHLLQRQPYFSADYLLTPRWRIGVGAKGVKQRNSDPLQQPNDIDIRDTEATVRYISPANASLGFISQAESGNFPNLESVAGSLIDDDYRQYSAGLVADWTPTEASHASGRIERSVRRYEQLPQRDFDGATGRAEYDWKPAGKFSLSLIAQRDISPYEYINSRLVLVSGITVSPALRLSEKTELSGIFGDSVRDYRGDPAVVLEATASRRDRIRSSMAMLSYRPIRAVLLQINAQQERNTSNIQFGDYVANVFSVTARISF